MSKILVDRKVLEQALEALEYENSWHVHHKVKPYVSTIDAITALRAALEQPEQEQEPVALWHRSGDGYSPVTVEQSHSPEPLTLDEALAQGWRRFYAHPPRRPWRGLTEEERRECTASPFVVDNYRAIEYKLKELNHHE